MLDDDNDGGIIVRRRQREDLAEECRRLRRLQAFRARNACALISLPRSPCGQGDARSTDDIAAEPPGDSRPNRHSTKQDRTVTTYRLHHLTCSMTPTVSVHKLDHTRPGNPSDAPPSVDARALRKAGVAAGGVHDIMLTRLIIPNISPTSVRCADHHRPSMPPASEQGREGEASLSIAHQRAGLSMTVGRAGKCTNNKSSRSEREDLSTRGSISSVSTGNTVQLSPS